MNTLRKNIISFMNKPKLCDDINYMKFPWGWKSPQEIDIIQNYKIDNKINLNDYERKYIHEYKLKEYCESMYYKTYYGYLNNYDFLDSNLFSIKLSLALNDLRSKINVHNLSENITINNIDILNTWIKYGSIRNNEKYLGMYNSKEIIHEICCGAIGPEIQDIWDQKGIKQKVRLAVYIDNHKDIIDIERDIMYDNSNWQLSNINRIII
tara:strand:- start:5411 stop:6037 length:627 start_codon:yes stop_codon:yes gene_type:complete